MAEKIKTCDLHTHSVFSDGSLTPEELVVLSKERGLSAVALTDHNTAKGLLRFTEAGEENGVTTVAGCEFSTEYEGTEVHIAALFLPPDAWDEAERYTKRLLIAKKNSNVLLIEALRRSGYDVTYEEAAALTDADEFNRAHVARLLLNKGYVNSTKEAFDTLLGEGQGYYVPPKRLDVFETIRFISSRRAVAVLAHPFLNLSGERLLKFLPQAKAAGLDAMETRYSSFDEETSREASKLARRFGLKESGGSDFHGAAKPDVMLGTGRGNLCVPFEFYEALKP
ncbi:MAG: PHP domain-containing protein [Clostridia bacterium]|nr:PHP domain-containing protein [Clostridia bacterium]